MTFRAALLSVTSLALVGALAATTTTAPSGVAWPVASPARLADASGALGVNVSGLARAGETSLWAVRDAPGALVALDRIGELWTLRADWGNGRALRYPDGHAGPDAEAVTTVDGDIGAVYVGAERDNADSSERRNSVLRYDTAGTGPLVATTEWRLDGLFSAKGANTGIEGLTWIADAALVAGDLREGDGHHYAPADHPAHGDGLFVVAAEQRSELYVVLLADDGRASLITTIPSALPTVMELYWSAEHRELWAVCDDTCDGVAALMRPSDGSFEVVTLVQPPSGSASLNDEGFVLLPCNAAKQSFAVWADDLATSGHVLRESALPCNAFAEVVGIAGPAPTNAATGSADAGTASADDRKGRSVGSIAIVVALVAACLAAAGLAVRRRRT